MPNKEMMAAIVLAAQAPRTVALAQEELKSFQASNLAHSYFIEAVEGSTHVSVPDADWEFRIVRIVRRFQMHDTVMVSATITAKHGHRAQAPYEEGILAPRPVPREPH